MAIAFAVDGVAPAERPPATHPLRLHLGAPGALGDDPELPVLAARGQPLLLAVHHAFAEHRLLLFLDSPFSSRMRLATDSTWSGQISWQMGVSDVGACQMVCRCVVTPGRFLDTRSRS